MARTRHLDHRFGALLAALAFVAAACGSTAQPGAIPAQGATVAAGPLPAQDAVVDGGLTAPDDALTVPDDGLSVPPSTSDTTTAFDAPATAGSASSAPAAPSRAGSPATSSGQPASVGGGSQGRAGGASQAAAPGGGGSSSTAPPPSQSAQSPAAPASTPPNAAPARQGRFAPGVTDKEIVIGIAIVDEGSPGNEELLGIEGITQGNVQRYYEIIAEDLNAKGGIAGRKIRYSTYRYSTADGAQFSQLEQAACTYWAQDDRAFAVAFTESDNFLGCAKDNGLVTSGDSLTENDDRGFATYPHHFKSSAMSLTRQMRFLPDGLVRAGYFDEGYKLGVLTYDTPTFDRAVEGTLRPALQRHGKEISEIARISNPESNSDLGKVGAEIQSAVLRFKTNGVTHVIFADERGLLTLLFLRSAENQAYRPRYGLTSQSGGTVIANVSPQGQLDRALGIGWLPNLDVLPAELPANPARERCLALYKEKGEEPANANNAAVMAGICERMLLTKAAVEAGLPDITPDSFMRGLESLRDSFPSLNSFSNVFGPGRHDGAGHYRTVAYDAGCNCFHYTSGLIPAQ
jgi:hypothetical protein